MSLPDGYRIRPVDPDRDLAAASALFEACDLADLGERDHQDAWIVQTWASAALRGAWFVESGADVIAYVEIESLHPDVAIDAFIPVHPDHRSGPLRASLLRFVQDRARGSAAGADVTLRLSGPASDGSFRDACEGAGFVHARTFWHMERDLIANEDPGDLPSGVSIRPSVDPVDDRVVHGVLDEAFRGHFGIEPMSFEEWSVDFKDGMYDPGLVLIAEVDGRPAGVAANWLPDQIGWVGDLGVLERVRGRGIGTALLRRSFSVLAERGATTVRLNVDGDNETGATRLYTSVGMRERRRWLVMEERLRPEG